VTFISLNVINISHPLKEQTEWFLIQLIQFYWWLLSSIIVTI